MKHKYKKLALLLSVFILQMSAFADMDVNVVGLFPGKAVVMVNKTKPVTLAVGQTSSEGIKLISSDGKKVVLEIDGVQKQLGMGQAAVVQKAAPESGNQSVTMYADGSGHYFVDGSINGYPRKFIVDTGASSVAMNSNDAQNAGIDYTKGQLIPLQTASGNAHGYLVSINTLKIRDLVLHQVDAVVIEGDAPSVVLLGMTALNRVDMKREGIVMTLTKKY